MKKQLLMTAAAVIGLSFAASGFAMTTYATKEGDGLWKVCKHQHPQGTTIDQCVAAVHNLNPKAFAHNGALKANQTLKVPTTKAEVMANIGKNSSKAQAASTQIPAVTTGAATQPVAQTTEPAAVDATATTESAVSAS